MSEAMLNNPGLGTYRLKDDVAYQAVTTALALGYRTIDTAQMYDNEAAVGKAIADSPVSREEVFVTTKVWVDQLSREHFRRSVEQSLSRLNMNQVDLLLVHWPAPEGGIPMAEYLGELKAAQEAGLTRHIGVSNFTIAQIDEALSILGPNSLLTNQVEIHPYLPNRKLVEHCQKHDILVTGYMPLAVGRVNDDPVLNAIAENKGVKPAQVALAWIKQRGIITIPSSTRHEHLHSNLAAMDLELTVSESARIDRLGYGLRLANPSFAPAWDLD
ncbi:2,5-didehydrogluconate reductase DkgB [Saccharospirillum alexandrii]|uniref:2,5-didehydrogluconate reductase DkgB n=1 Tax=Saccharospirillum alexandrii TaxID=2448477 RepID=UPI000FDCD485|nr:2,5-didehydrogluconate reductase DkgB [Saccharospirillum alexandrii]